MIRPVVNITSARLILGADAEPTYVSEEAINAERIGEPIGILNAPAKVPDPDELVETGWTACTSAGTGLRLRLAADAGVVAAPRAGFLVESQGVRYVIAQAASAGGEQPSAYTFALPRDPGAQDNMLRDLGLGVGADAMPVSSDWLRLWPVGGALAWPTFGIDGAGQPAAYAGGSTGIPAKARVGDIVTTPGESVVLAADGPVPLDAFSLAVLRNSDIDGRPVRELEADRIGVARQPPNRAAHWPETTLSQVRGEYCAELDAAAGQVPVVALGVQPTPDASSRDVPARQRAVSVSAGGGAYVLSGAWTSTDDGSPFLVDTNGVSYPLVGRRRRRQPRLRRLRRAGRARLVGRAPRPGGEPLRRGRAVPARPAERQGVRVSRLAGRRRARRWPAWSCCRRSPRPPSTACCARASATTSSPRPTRASRWTCSASRTPRTLLGGPAGAGAGVNVAVLDSGVSRQGGGVDVTDGTSSRAAARSRTRTARPSRR